MTIDQVFLRLYSYQLFVLLLCAVLYFKAAEIEGDDSSPIIWAGLSVLVYLGTWILLDWGLLGNLAGQAGLLAAITAWRLRK